MRAAIIAILVAGALMPVAAATAAEGGFEPRTFTVRVDDVRLQARLLERGHARDGRARVTVPAIIFDEPVRIDDVRDYGGGERPLVDFLAACWRANVAGDAEAVVAHWCRGARADIRRFVANEAVFERNRRALEQRPGLTVLGLVRHDDTVSILQHRGHAVTGVAVRRGRSGPCLVRAPADDVELAIIEASFE